MDYKETLNLPKTRFPMRANLPQNEPAQVERWRRENVYEKILEANQKRDKYILHDGPPYANGNIHLGHALNKILKDIIVKYKNMTGHLAPYIPGWDCHGLPIELQVEKNIGRAKKKNLSQLEVRRLCKEYAQKYISIQREEFRRLGVLGDWENPYRTIDYAYEAAEIRELGKFIAAGSLYRQKKPVYWCASCHTALAEAEVEYEDHTSPSIYVKFPVTNPQGKFSLAAEGTSFVIWTTTPWTLPANQAIALHPRFMYRHVKTPAGEVILNQELIETVMKALGFSPGSYEVTSGAWTGTELEGVLCRHPWIDREVKIVLGEFVTQDQGTGCVHIAPGHGQEDYEVGQRYGLEVLAPVDAAGKFTAEAGDLAGEFVFEADPKIVQKLRERQALLSQELCEHVASIFEKEGSDAWFIRPAAELVPSDLCCPGCGGKEFSKEEDILDVWFDSGVSHAGVVELDSRLGGRADLYLEGSDQHRGWFHTALLTSVATRSRAPYQSVLTHGFTLDGKGRKMSKSLGNVIAPQEIIKKSGAEILRLWAAAEDYREDVRISDEILNRLVEAYRKLRNTARFLISNLYDFEPDKDALTPKDLQELDRWILHRTQKLLARCREAYGNFEFHVVYHALNNFCSVDLSALYLDIVKDRLYCEGADSKERRAAQTALYRILETLVHLMAPVLSFTAEEIWEHMPKKMGAPESIFLSAIPLPDEAFIDEGLATRWDQTFRVREEVLKVLEECRKPSEGEGILGHIIGHSLDAEIFLDPDRYDSGFKEVFRIHNPQAWEDIFIVSKVELGPGGIPDSFRSDQDEKFTGSFEIIHPNGREGRKYESPFLNGPILVFKAQGQKCERCWKYSEDVGRNSDHPTVCARCSSVLMSGAFS